MYRRQAGRPRYGPVMDDEDGYFGERVAARYDESSADMFEPGVVDAAVDVLAGLAGGGRALGLGVGTGRIALPLARRGVPVHGIDLSRAMIARLRGKPGGDSIGVTIGDFATTKGGRDVFRRVLGLQHDHESDDTGRAGSLLPQHSGSPRTRRPLRHRGRYTRSAKAAARAERRAISREPDAMGIRRLRRRHAGDEFELRAGRRRQGRVHLNPLPVRVAGRTRPDGPARRAGTTRAMGRLDAGTFHEREPPACLDLGKAHHLTASQASAHSRWRAPRPSR